LNEVIPDLDFGQWTFIEYKMKKKLGPEEQELIKFNLM
jgi:hypothetical protein